MVDYVTLKIPEELSDEVDKVVEMRLRGYRSRAEFVNTAIREFLKEFKDELKLQIEHYNIHENRVVLFDNKLKKIIEVFMYQDKLYCEYHASHKCEHIDFIIELPEVIQLYREKGVNVNDIKLE